MKKNWNVAKIFTLLITVLFLASTLFVGCKEQEPEPEPEPSPVMYTVTYAVEGGGNSVTGIPEPKTVEKGTVLKVDDLPTLTEPEGWTFEGWYIGEEPFTSDYTVTSNIIITAKFVENVAPSLPEDPTDPENPTNPEDPTDPVDPEDPADPETPVTYIVVYDGAQIATLTEEEYIEYGNMLTATEDYTYNAETKTITLTDAGYAKVMGGEEEPEVPEQPVTYTVTYTVEGIDANLVEDLPESGTVNEDTVISLPSLVSPTGYVFDGWFIDSVGVSSYTVVADVTIVAKFSVIAEEEPSKTTYTITNVKASWVGDNDVVVYAYLPAAATEDDVQKDYLFGASYEDGVVSFSTDEEFSTAVVITVPNGTSIDGLSPTSDENGPDIWDYKLLQTDDLDFTGTTTVALPDVSTVTFYVKIPTWDPAITPVKIAIADNGYNWDEFEMEDCGNSWFKYEATNIHDLNSSTTYQLRLVQGESVKYQRAGNNQDNPAIAAPDGFVVIDLTSSMEWGDGCAGGFYTTAVTTPETVPELN